jgi:riboflavin biosynthesis pyrimidine reductase
MEPGSALADALDPYRVERPPPADRPWVLANMVAGVDGCAAVAGKVGALSDATDAALFRALRSVADVVLVGAATVRQEGYGPVRLAPELVERRRAEGRRPIPPIAVVSRALTLDWTSTLGTDGEGGARPIVVTAAAADGSLRAEATALADVLLAGDDRVDLGEALRLLRRDHGAEVVLCEGGPTILGQLAADDLLDELCLTVTPRIGGDPLPVAVVPAGAPLRALALRHVLHEDGTLFLRYTRG